MGIEDVIYEPSKEEMYKANTILYDRLDYLEEENKKLKEIIENGSEKLAKLRKENFKLKKEIFKLKHGREPEWYEIEED